MEESDVNRAFSKIIRGKFEAPRQTRAQSRPVPLARELTPRLTRENLEKHNKFVGDFECPCREDDLEPWTPFRRSVTHVEYKGSIGGVLMQRQPASQRRSRWSSRGSITNHDERSNSESRAENKVFSSRSWSEMSETFGGE